MLFLRLLGAKDSAFYLLCSLFGYVVFLALRPAAWAGAAAALTTYHLFLSFRIFASDPGKDRTRTYSLTATIAAHLGFVAVCIFTRMAAVALIHDSLSSQPGPLHGPAILVGAKAIGILSVAIVYGIVSLECHLLFRGRSATKMQDLEPAMIELSAKLRKNDTELMPATPDDHNAWLQYCSRRKSTFYNPALTPRDDFEQWLRARGKTQYQGADNSYAWITAESQSQRSAGQMPSLSGD